MATVVDKSGNNPGNPALNGWSGTDPHNATTKEMQQDYYLMTPTTVAKLTTPATAGIGARGFVTDANATTFNSVVASGGANKVPVFCDGTSWRIG